MLSLSKHNPARPEPAEGSGTPFVGPTIVSGMPFRAVCRSPFSPSPEMSFRGRGGRGVRRRSLPQAGHRRHPAKESSCASPSRGHSSGARVEPDASFTKGRSPCKESCSGPLCVERWVAVWPLQWRLAAPTGRCGVMTRIAAQPHQHSSPPSCISSGTESCTRLVQPSLKTSASVSTPHTSRS